MNGSRYVGRFAPSPSGPLHQGSLIAALASYLDARSRRGLWLIRIEDIDPPREVSGAARQILCSLRRHGLNWDGEPVWQSHNHRAYHGALATLAADNSAFPCDCSRKQLAKTGGIYPGRCRDRIWTPPAQVAIRARVSPQLIGFDDLIQGPQSQQLDRAVGDFVVRRRDGLPAYQLAVVVDDAAQGITHVIRGADLLDSTPRQIYLQRTLGLPTPRYGHFPVLTNRQGQKLSKQHCAPALDDTRPVDNLLAALGHLGQTLPAARPASAGELLQWAAGHWQLSAIPATGAITDLRG